MMSVYVIGTASGDRHKIGVSAAPERRLAALQTASPERLVLIWARQCDDASWVERETHRLLARSALHGEWFGVSAQEAKAAVERAIEAPPRSPAPDASAEGEPVRVMLRQECAAAGSIAAWAAEHRVSPAYINDVLKGRREPGAAILRALGLERVVSYRRVPRRERTHA